MPRFALQRRIPLQLDVSPIPEIGEEGSLPEGPGPFPAADTDYVYLLMPVRLPG